MSYDPLVLCKNEGDYFEVDPGKMYPATFARIKEALAGAVPTEIVTPGWTGLWWQEEVVKKFMAQAAVLTKEDWDTQSAALLDFARSWFTRALTLAVGKPIRIHISRNPDYRR